MFGGEFGLMKIQGPGGRVGFLGSDDFKIYETYRLKGKFEKSSQPPGTLDK